MSVPPFRFNLERVRALRERAEEQAREALAGVMATRQDGEVALDTAAEALERAHAARRHAAFGGRASGSDLRATQAWLERSERAVHVAALHLDRCDAELDARRAAFEHAARQRGVLERLKERRHADHVRHARRAEGAILDELALGMHRREAA
jgi:flagellar protein FliJ